MRVVGVMVPVVTVMRVPPNMSVAVCSARNMPVRMAPTSNHRLREHRGREQNGKEAIAVHGSETFARSS